MGDRDFIFASVTNFASGSLPYHFYWREVFMPHLGGRSEEN